jgi:hypothetical protein
MWILDAMVKVPFQRLYLTLLTALGAGFLLLALFFYLNPLSQPVIYALVALSLFFIQRKEVSILRGALFVIASTLLARFLIPEYIFLYSVGFSLLAGKLIFPASIRFWKWTSCALFFYAAIHITSTWQQIDPFHIWIPFELSPVLHAAILSFCIACSLLPYYLIKDSVLSTYESYPWQERSEPGRIALQAKDLYEAVKTELRKQRFDEQVIAEVEEFSEKMIHLCHQLQEINDALSHVDTEHLEGEIAELELKVETCSDLASKKNYQKALTNRRKQREQHEALATQAERIRAQVLNYISALENVRFAYTHRHFSSAEQGTEGIEFLLQMAKNQAENVYETSEAYQKLV